MQLLVAALIYPKLTSAWDFLFNGDGWHLGVWHRLLQIKQDMFLEKLSYKERVWMDTIAIWGAITGSLSLLLYYLNYRKDRANIELKISAEKWQQYSATIHILIVNQGRRPISIKEGLLENVDEGARDIKFNPPLELTEYKSYTWSGMIPNFYKKNLDVKDLYAEFFCEFDLKPVA
ncbi:MAG: hypothetical protein WC592_06970 [Candidatus Omnitrophota bacterium]